MNNKALVSMAKFIRKNLKTIYVVTGIASMVGGAVSAVFSTRNAMRHVGEAEIRKGEELTKKEVVKETWSDYILPVTLEIGGAVLIATGFHSANKQLQVMSTMYSVAETALSEYKRATKEVVSEKEAEEIDHKVVENRVNDNPPPKETAPDLMVDIEANTLCFDLWSNRYFYSNRETILRAVNNLNRMMVSQDYIPRSEFCYQVHEAYNRTDDDYGYNVEDGLIDVTFDTTFAPDGRPCMTVDTNVKPKRDYMH